MKTKQTNSNQTRARECGEADYEAAKQRAAMVI